MFTIKRGLPKITVWDSEGKRVLEGQELISMLMFQFCNNGYQRTYLIKKLPLDILDMAFDRREEYLKERHKSSKIFNINKDYTDYIHSKEWRKLRKEILTRRNKCEKCGNENIELHLHHLSYGNFKNETDSDFLVLCCDCHSDEHGRRVGRF